MFKVHVGALKVESNLVCVRRGVRITVADIYEEIVVQKTLVLQSDCRVVARCGVIDNVTPHSLSPSRGPIYQPFNEIFL